MQIRIDRLMQIAELREQLDADCGARFTSRLEEGLAFGPGAAPPGNAAPSPQSISSAKITSRERGQRIHSRVPTDATASEPATANTTASISQNIPRSGTSAATTTTGPAITVSVANTDNGKNARKRRGSAAARELEESGAQN